MDCRNILCRRDAVGYARIYHVYEDGQGPVLDVDYAYCYFHLAQHRRKDHKGLNIQFFDSLEGIRP